MLINTCHPNLIHGTVVIFLVLMDELEKKIIKMDGDHGMTHAAVGFAGSCI